MNELDYTNEGLLILPKAIEVKAEMLAKLLVFPYKNSDTRTSLWIY